MKANRKASAVRILKRTPIYALLALGSVVFSLPFLWMATTSVKVDRELYTEELRVFPMSPAPRAKSPYVDERYFADVDGPHLDELLPRLARVAEDKGVAIPEDVDRAAALDAIARGLYRRMSKRLPTAVWDAGADAVADAARESVTEHMVASAFASPRLNSGF